MKKRERGAAGRILLDWRERRGYTQEKLAGRSGVGVSSIGAIERGEERPAGEKLARLCIALDLEPEALLVEIARAEAGELKALVQEIRGKQSPSGSQGSPAGSNLFFLAAQVSRATGDASSMDALLRLISNIQLGTLIVEPEPDGG